MYGQIHSLTQNESGCWCMTVIIDVPYERQFKRFLVWRRKEYDMKRFAVGDYITFEYEGEASPSLISISKTDLKTCYKCRAFTPDETCGKCDDIENRPNFICDVFECVGFHKTQFKFTRGNAITFYHNRDDCNYLTRVYVSSPLYKPSENVDIGKCYKISGWVTSSLQKNLCSFNMTEEPIEMYSNKRTKLE